MKIAIDASQIIYETGVSNYTSNLISALLSLDKVNNYIIFGGSLRKHNVLKSKLLHFHSEHKRNCKTKAYYYPPYITDLIWNRLGLFPVETVIGNCDIFHSSDWSQPESRAFSITTIHDLVPILFPKLSNPKLVAVHKRRLARVRRFVDRIIVPSNITKNDLIKLGFDGEIIRVIPEAPDAMFKPQIKENVEFIKRKYRILGKYLLAVGVAPRKNTERLIEAFEKIKAEYNLKLVIVGHKYSKIEERRGVIYLGHVHTNDLPALYSGSMALVYPSLYEGFGLPILEAFATQIPVITSNFGSMKELAGGAAILVDPYDVDSISNGIIEAFENRKNLIKSGKALLTGYSWGKTAKATLDVYKESL